MKSRRSIFTNRHLAVEIWLRASPFQRSRFAGHALRTPHSRRFRRAEGAGGLLLRELLHFVHRRLSDRTPSERGGLRNFDLYIGGDNMEIRIEYCTA